MQATMERSGTGSVAAQSLEDSIAYVSQWDMQVPVYRLRWQGEGELLDRLAVAAGYARDGKVQISIVKLNGVAALPGAAGAWLDDFREPTLLAIKNGGSGLLQLFLPDEITTDWLLNHELELELQAALRRHGAPAKRAATALIKDAAFMLPGLLDAASLDFLRRYINYLKSHNGFSDCSQTAGRLARNNDKVMRWLNVSFNGIVEQTAGMLLKPSYSYLAEYTAGSELKPHTDREQCEWTMSLALDVTPAQASADSWALHVAAPGSQEPLAITTGNGDGAMFTGRTLTHWRNPCPFEAPQRYVFLHYVPRDFMGELN